MTLHSAAPARLGRKLPSAGGVERVVSWIKQRVPDGIKRRLRRRLTRDGRAFSEARWRLARRYLIGDGIEIGALHMPLKVPSSVTVRYVDRFPAGKLRQHYPELNGVKLVDVDIVDDGEVLRHVERASLDFVVANHFYEHCEDPIGTLSNHLRVLKPGGILYMAIPDKRKTFDRDRPITNLDHVIRDHTEGPARSRMDHYEEWAMLVDPLLHDWWTAKGASGRARQLAADNYSIHFHVWTPTAFLQLLLHCVSSGFPLEVEALERNQHEFIVVLRKSEANGLHKSGASGSRGESALVPPGDAYQ